MSTSGRSGAPFIWEPTPDGIRATNVMRLAQANGVGSYSELLRRSQEEPEWFWHAVVNDLGIEFEVPYERVLDASEGIAWTKWFVGGQLNLAWNCVGRWALETPHALAAIGVTEDDELRSLTYTDLWREICQLGSGLRELGVTSGDRVGIYLPMVAEAVVASHACALIGAIQVPIFSGLAAPAVQVRLADAGVKVVITADATLRNGKVHRMKDVVDEAIIKAECVEHVVVLERLGDDQALRSSRHDVLWAELISEQPHELEAEPFDSEHPYCLSYTSGTTGRPKGAVHATAGLLVKVLEEAAYQTDLRSADTLYWVTDIGWFMGAWEIVGATGLGATVVLAEGAPNITPDRLWSLCDRFDVTVLGLSPTLVRGLIPYGEEPVVCHDLSSLRILASTGEPWNPEPYRWLFTLVGRGRLPIINMSGGTEVGACFLSSSPALPVKECSVGGPALGMVVDVVDADGTPVRDSVGELVCRTPWPSMTRGIWHDPERYMETYWRRFAGIWTHGDWAKVDEDGYWFLLGRSDDTINVAGKRIGPAEFESILVSHRDVAEAGVAGIPDSIKGEVPWCFCVPAPSAVPGEALALELIELVSSALGRSFRPARIVFVPALPKTRSAKIARRVLRAAAMRQDPGDVSSLEDASVIDLISACAPLSPGPGSSSAFSVEVQTGNREASS